MKTDDDHSPVWWKLHVQVLEKVRPLIHNLVNDFRNGFSISMSVEIFGSE